MKRMVAVILAVMMIVMAGCVAQASELSDMASTVKATAKELLNQMIVLYEIAPDKFDADYISMFHAYLKLYESGTELQSAALRFNIKDMVSSGFVVYDDSARTLETSVEQMYQILDNDYMKWLNQEITDQEYCEKVIRTVKAMINV